MKKTSHPSPEWFVYTADDATFDYITNYLRANGDRQEECLMTEQQVTDQGSPVTLRRITLVDKRTLDSASLRLSLKFRVYLRLYPDGPIQYFETTRSGIRAKKVVLLASVTLSSDALKEKAVALKKSHPGSEYIVADQDLRGVTYALMNRSFIDEVGIYGDKLMEDGKTNGFVFTTIQTAMNKNINVVSMDTKAKEALAELTMSGDTTGKKKMRA